MLLLGVRPGGKGDLIARQTILAQLPKVFTAIFLPARSFSELILPLSSVIVRIVPHAVTHISLGSSLSGVGDSGGAARGA